MRLGSIYPQSELDNLHPHQLENLVLGRFSWQLPLLQSDVAEYGQ